MRKNEGIWYRRVKGFAIVNNRFVQNADQCKKHRPRRGPRTVFIVKRCTTTLSVVELEMLCMHNGWVPVQC